MKIIGLLLFILVSFSCSKEDVILPEYNATVLSYDGRKAYCLYGWKIKIGNDTILTTSDIVRQKIGYKINEPIPVNIEVYIIDDFCKYPYCEVLKIEK